MIRTARAILRKDLLIEFRSREIVYTTLFFAVSVMLVFSFSFVREGVAVEGAALPAQHVFDRASLPAALVAQDDRQPFAEEAARIAHAPGHRVDQLVRVVHRGRMNRRVADAGQAVGVHAGLHCDVLGSRLKHFCEVNRGCRSMRRSEPTN